MVLGPVGGPQLLPRGEWRKDPGLHSVSEPGRPAWCTSCLAGMPKVGVSQPGCGSRFCSWRAPSPRAHRGLRVPSHCAQQLNARGPGVEVGVGVRTAVKDVALLSQELSLVVLARNWAATTLWPQMSLGTVIICDYSLFVPQNADSTLSPLLPPQPFETGLPETLGQELLAQRCAQKAPASRWLGPRKP